MSSSWKREILAVLDKEAKVELRSKTGMATSLVFGLATIVTVAFALLNVDPNKPELQEVCSSLVWTILLFASLLSLPRTFLAEEEQGTADILRLAGRPHSVYWGKVIFNLIQIWILCALVSVVFIALTGLYVQRPLLLVGSLFGGGAALASAVTLCGAIASHAANRAALAGAIAIPLVLFPAQWGVSGLRAAFGVGLLGGGQIAVIGLTGYAAISLAIGPWLYAAIWKS